MEVVDSRSVFAAALSELDYGAVFQYSNNTYIKVDINSSLSEKTIYAINLHSGKAANFSKDTVVIPREAEVHLK